MSRHRIICLLNLLFIIAGAGRPAQVYHFMKANIENQPMNYAKPEVELIDINPAGVICTSGETISGVVSGQDPDAPNEIDY